MVLSEQTPLYIPTAPTGSNALEPQSLPQGALSLQSPRPPTDCGAVTVGRGCHKKLVAMNGSASICA